MMREKPSQTSEALAKQAESELIYDVFDGLWTEGFETPRTITGESGKIALATDIGLRTGINEDAVLLDTANDAFAVIDGMSGYENGEVAARIVAEEIQQGIKSNASPSDMQTGASRRMRHEGITQGGACYAAGKIEGKELYTWHAGDVRLMLIDRKGNIKFETRPTSLHDAPSGRGPGKPAIHKTDFMNYDRIIVASDGLWDNATVEEIIKAAAEAPIDEALQKLSGLAKEAMQGRRIEGGNKDNLTILMYEILPVPLRGKK